MNKKSVNVIGGGLAGTEAAFWLAEQGIPVDLYEMRPGQKTEAHQTQQLAELVCSNSFKSLSPATAPGILKREMEILGSHAIRAARHAAIGAGEALAVDRELFSTFITATIEKHPLIKLHREEISKLPEDPESYTILATGPLTSPSLSESLRQVTGEEHFYFYDAISPIVDAIGLDYEKIFRANRYGKKTRALENIESVEIKPEGEEEEDSGDYLNCPFTKGEYEAFIDLLLRSERVVPKTFERVKHFEGCMPIEEMADRGRETLRHGPMKPMGLVDPRTGQIPHAVVQLRTENRSKGAFNLVGFQTKLKYGEQGKVFRTIPGLENAEFLRYGSMHRNSFVDAPRVLLPDLSLKNSRHTFLAGQITGVEGYMESAAMGMLAGIFLAARLANRPIPSPPAASAFGALLEHLRNTRNTDFQPSGINFGLFEDSNFADALAPLQAKYKKKIPKVEKRKALGLAACANMAVYAKRIRTNP